MNGKRYTRRQRRRCVALFLFCATTFPLICFADVTTGTADACEPEGAAPVPVVADPEPVFVTPPPVKEAEPDEPEPVSVGEFTVTHYCCEKREHICGTGDGLTASGTEVTAYRSCAVDPSVIPLGSVVILHMEDGRILRYIAEDTGGAIKGNRIDLAVSTHAEALEAGITTASVYVEAAANG